MYETQKQEDTHSHHKDEQTDPHTCTHSPSFHIAQRTCCSPRPHTTGKVAVVGEPMASPN